MLSPIVLEWSEGSAAWGLPCWRSRPGSQKPEVDLKSMILQPFQRCRLLRSKLDCPDSGLALPDCRLVDPGSRTSIPVAILICCLLNSFQRSVGSTFTAFTLMFRWENGLHIQARSVRLSFKGLGRIQLHLEQWGVWCSLCAGQAGQWYNILSLLKEDNLSLESPMLLYPPPMHQLTSRDICVPRWRLQQVSSGKKGTATSRRLGGSHWGCTPSVN